jgi:protein-disulfide isomerase
VRTQSIIKVATVFCYGLAACFLTATAFRYLRQGQTHPIVVASSAKKFLIQSPSEARAVQEKKPVIVAFVDFQCPFCRSSLPELLRWAPVQHGDVALSLRQLPLSKLHPFAYPSAVLFEMSSRQSGPYEAAKALLQEDIPKLMADRIKLDTLIGPVRESAAALARRAVDLDANTAKNLEVQSTPSFFVIRSSGEVVRARTVNEAETLCSRYRFY